MGVYYSQKYSPLSVAEGVRAMTLAYYRQAAEDGHKHHHVFLKRTKKYNPTGRFQNEEEAKLIDVGLKGMLEGFRADPWHCDTDRQSLEKLLLSLNISKEPK